MKVLVVLLLLTIVLLIYFVVSSFRNNAKNIGRKGYIIVPCSSSTDDIEKTVKSYYWEEIFESNDLGREIIIVIVEHSKNDYTARKLSAELPIVSVVDITAVEDYIKRREYIDKDNF